MNNKGSFLEQLFKSIFNEKNLTPKNVILLIILISVIGIIGVCLSISSVSLYDDDGDNYFTADYNISVLEEVGYSKAEIENMSNEDIDSIANDIIVRTHNQIAGDEWKSELSYSESNEIKTRFYQYAVAGDYKSIIKEFKDLKLNYYLSEPYNKRLIKIYNDAYIINSAFEDKNNLVQQKDTLTKINDERMLLCALLQSSLEVRNSTIKDRISLTLSDENNNLRINSVSSSTMTYSAQNGLYKDDANLTKMFQYLNEGDYITYKINFHIGTDNFNIYMYKDLYNMSLSVYGMYPDNEAQLSSVYTTVAESEAILSDIYNYNNSIENSNSSYDNLDTEQTINNSENFNNEDIVNDNINTNDDYIYVDDDNI